MGIYLLVFLLIFHEMLIFHYFLENEGKTSFDLKLFSGMYKSDDKKQGSDLLDHFPVFYDGICIRKY